MLVGTETEYGIAAPGRPDADAHLLSALVVDACPVAATGAVEDTHNRVLGNGARLYVDHGHPEYAGPECTSAASEAATAAGSEPRTEVQGKQPGAAGVAAQSTFHLTSPW